MKREAQAGEPAPEPNDTPQGNSSNITALPTPTAEETLRQKLTEAESSISMLKAEVGVLSRNYDKVKEQRDHLLSKVQEIEKNALLFTLNNLDAGAVLTDAGEQLKQLAATVRRRDAKGTFTLKLGVKPFKGSADALVITPEVKITEPAEEPHNGIFFSDDDGSLSRQDPRQREFGFGTREDRAEAYERRHPETR